MGCDIHMFAEKRNPVTNEWDVIGEEFTDSYALWSLSQELKEVFGLEEEEAWEITMKWVNGESPTNRQEQYIISKFIPKRVAPADASWEYTYSKGMIRNPYTNQPYGGRCYSLFGILAGVRDQSNPMIGAEFNSDIKGVPDDASMSVKSMSDEWDIDGHSHNYFTLRELLDSEYNKMDDNDLKVRGIDPYFFNTTIPQLQKLGQPEDVRIIFWFDN
tara:strand:- start:779 stop:1426 length:648 start_codon:yes stop_codon:yes gene_type:complete